MNNMIEAQLQALRVGTEQITPEQDLVKKLSRGIPLRVKLGMDPTSADLHLGHAVVLSKMKQLQDMGHEIIFLIGDFTARIGDPTGKSKTRPALTEVEIAHNMKTYFEQVGRILDPAGLRICYNSQWLDTLSIKEMVQLCSRITVARLTEREDFANRLHNQQPISFHELLYPLFQGYDSVVLNADIELGGTDQTFNLLMGRYLQEQYGQEPQVIITMPLLEGLDGNQKMSKSLGNTIGLSETADQAYGKLMSISDILMFRYAQILLHADNRQICHWQESIAAGTLHPMELKKDIAQQIVARFWTSAQAVQARQTFQALFQEKDYSHAQEITVPDSCTNPIWIVDLLKLLNAVESSSHAKRLIESGAIHLDDMPVKDFKMQVTWHKGMIIKVGKHGFYKLI